MRSCTPANILDLWHETNSLIEYFKEHGTYLYSLKVVYSCSGGSCEVLYHYATFREIVENHEVVRFISANIASIPPDIQKQESKVTDIIFKLLTSIHGDGFGNEAGCGGYLIFELSSRLIIGQHIQEEINEDELGQFHPEHKQVYVLTVKCDEFEDDWKIIEHRVQLE